MKKVAFSAIVLIFLILTTVLIPPPPVQAGLLGGAIDGGLIDGRRGVRAWAVVGGNAGD